MPNLIMGKKLTSRKEDYSKWYTIRNSRPRLIVIKAMQKIKASTSKQNYDEVPF